MGRFARVLGLGSVFVCAACNGFPDAAPIAEAERKPETYPSYAGVTAAPLIATEGQRWLILEGGHIALPAGTIQPIATGGGGEISVAKWDQPPYDLIYARTPKGSFKVAGEIR